MPIPPLPDPPLPDDDVAREKVAAMAEALAGTLRTAEALARGQRSISLDGLEQQIGRLCARALDLPPEHGRSLRPSLIALLACVDSLLPVVAGP